MNLDAEQALFDACRDVPPEERERRLADCLDTALAERVRRLLAAYDREFPPLEAGAHGLSPLAMPRRVGAYHVVGRIGEGAMGEVFLAEQHEPVRRRVALKVLKFGLATRDVMARFELERRALATLTHCNIARFFDAGATEDGRPYFAMEHVDGVPITTYCDDHGLDLGQRLALFGQVCVGVQHAHLRGIIHRDLKPSNVLVTEIDGRPAPRIIDFGIAKATTDDGTHTVAQTRFGHVLGTPEYMSPEQAQLAPLDIDLRTDVYSLGVMLYELLTGERPYSITRGGISRERLAREIGEGDARRPSDCVTGSRAAMLRGGLDWITLKAIEKDRTQRYSSVHELIADLERHRRNEAVLAGPPSLSYRAGRFVRRHRGSVAAGAVIALVLVGATVLTTLQMFEARRQRDAAVYQSRRAEFQARFAYLIMSEVGSDGRPVTIRQLMEKGIEVLEKSYGDDPRFVIGMLVNISGRYMNLGDTNGEYATLVKAERLARQLGDAEQIAYVQCNTVDVELAAGRPEQARERLRDGLANLAKLPNPPMERQAECGTAQARLLWSEGRLPEAIEAATRITRLLEERGETGALLYRTLCSMLEVMLGREGRRREAREWNRRLIAELVRSGDTSGMSMSMARHNQAAHLYDAGEVRAALDVQRTVVEQLEAQQGLDSVLAGFAHRLGIYQVRVDETDAGLVWLDRAVADSAALNERPAQIGALLNRAQAYVLLGQLERGLADVEAAERLAQDDHDALRAAHFVRAQLLVARGEPAAAIKELDEILAAIGYPQKRLANRLAPMLILKGRAELVLGRNDAALATARDAHAIAEANAPQPERSAVVGAALMLVAEAQRANGDAGNARVFARRAAVALSVGLGPDHSETRAALLFH